MIQLQSLTSEGDGVVFVEKSCHRGVLKVGSGVGGGGDESSTPERV